MGSASAIAKVKIIPGVTAYGHVVSEWKEVSVKWSWHNDELCRRWQETGCKSGADHAEIHQHTTKKHLERASCPRKKQILTIKSTPRTVRYSSANIHVQTSQPSILQGHHQNNKMTQLITLEVYVEMRKLCSPHKKTPMPFALIYAHQVNII